MYFIPYYYYNMPMFEETRQPIHMNRAWEAGAICAYCHTPVHDRLVLEDFGPNPLVIDINQAAKQNQNYRTTLWTGSHLQVTLMSIPVGGDIGLEIHPDHDQFLRIEQGQGLVQMGKSKDHLNVEKRVSKDAAIVVPAGTWHNVRNTGRGPLKLYSIYAPPEHPFGTVHATKADALAAEGGY